MIRLATIGTNFITDWLMEGILELDEIQLTAVYSRNLEKGKKYMITTKRWQKIQRLMRFM